MVSGPSTFAWGCSRRRFSRSAERFADPEDTSLLHSGRTLVVCERKKEGGRTSWAWPWKWTAPCRLGAKRQQVLESNAMGA